MSHVKLQRGFALPTILISSVVMMVLLVSGLAAASSINIALRAQYHDQLAKEAAESGINFVVGCIQNNQVPGVGDTGNPTWKPNSKSCTDNSLETVSPGSKSKFVMGSESEVYRTRYVVSKPTLVDGYYTIASTGTLELYRENNLTGLAWKSVDKTLNLSIRVQSLFASEPATGYGYSCAILSGESWCWGANANGQMGNGTVIAGSPSYAIDAEGNPLATKVIRDDSNTVSYSTGTFSRSLLKTDIDIGAGSGTTCNLSTNHPPVSPAAPQTNVSSNMVYCWGLQDEGALGNERTTNVQVATPVPVSPTWLSASQRPIDVAVGGKHACALTDGDKIWCWGLNDDGQLGRNNSATNSSTASPDRVVSVSGGGFFNAKYLSASRRNTCAVEKSSSIAHCWGDNSWDQTGTNVSGDILRPTPVVVATGGSPPFYAKQVETNSVTAVLGGNATGHGCGIGDNPSNSASRVGVKDGVVYCWGSSEYGQASGAVGSTSTRKRAQTIPISGYGPSGTDYYADSVSLSFRATCALVRPSSTSPASSKKIFCWGDNRNGELGSNEIPNSKPATNTPTQIHINTSSPLNRFNMADVSQITQGGAGARFCLIARSYNYCWGLNGVGQTGDGTTEGDFTTAQGASEVGRFYPRRSIFADPVDGGVVY